MISWLFSCRIPYAAFRIVEAEIFGIFFLPELEVHRNTFDALLLDGPGEPLQIGLVVRRPGVAHSGEKRGFQSIRGG